MKKLAYLILLTSFLSGCATYKYHHGQPPYDKGYVVSRDDYTILEYTLGPNNTVPERKLAKERFLRRRNTVEDYYKRMGYIENHFKMAVWDPAVMFCKLIGGVFRLPFVAVSDYRYEHNPKYREKIKALEAEKDAQEETRIKTLKEKLSVYIQKDLAREPAGSGINQPSSEPLPAQETKVAPLSPEALAKTEAPLEKNPQEPMPLAPEKTIIPPKELIGHPVEIPAPALAAKQEEIKPEIPVAEEIKPLPTTMVDVPQENARPLLQEKALLEAERQQRLANGVVAVIMAKPMQGYSPLRVSFDARKSHSRQGRIISCLWDFGDGDTSPKANPVNTYYSGSFEPKKFNVTLTVRDNQGNTGMASCAIEVLNK